MHMFRPFFLHAPATTETYTLSYTTLFRSLAALSLHSDLMVRQQGLEKKLSALEKHVEAIGRSEEHTSELQSHVNLVCRLLLEKKKTTRLRKNSATHTSGHSPASPPYTYPP